MKLTTMIKTAVAVVAIATIATSLHQSYSPHIRSPANSAVS
ncbi:hypothetical protein KST_04416 [Mycobacterium marinum]|nr:hypothetical protein KST_04416 [Mycobacterium marinum]